MYRNILLAYDGSLEGRRALREGATLALLCGAKTFLLAVVETNVETLAVGAYVGAFDTAPYEEVLAEGVQRLKALGFEPDSRLEWGDPGQRIVAVASEINADLVVAGHRRKGLFAQWWSGSVGTYLAQNLQCSLLITQREIDDEEFNRIRAKPLSE